jgi:hypothetical protein
MNPPTECSLLFSDLLVRLTARRLVERFGARSIDARQR